jgi:hypothetical protein
VVAEDFGETQAGFDPVRGNGHGCDVVAEELDLQRGPAAVVEGFSHVPEAAGEGFEVAFAAGLPSVDQFGEFVERVVGEAIGVVPEPNAGGIEGERAEFAFEEGAARGVAGAVEGGDEFEFLGGLFVGS